MPRLNALAAVATLALGAASALHAANDWQAVTFISDTVGNHSNRLCMGVPDHMRGSDIGCPTYAPSLTTGGHVSITGNVSANRFIGDGSGLTGVAAATGDRIVSGSTGGTRMVAISATGYISITQAGANTGWFDPTRGLVTLGVSATGAVSGTNGYFSERVGIGSAPGGFGLTLFRASGGLARFGNNNVALDIHAEPTLNDRVMRFSNTSSWAQGGFDFYASNATFEQSRLRIQNDGRVGIGTTVPVARLHVEGGAETTSELRLSTGATGTLLRHVSASTGESLFDIGSLPATGADTATVRLFRNTNTTGLVHFVVGRGNGTATSNAVIGGNTHSYLNATIGNLGVGKTLPLAKLDVAGSISASDAIQVGGSSLTCGAGIAGALRYSGSKIEYCNGVAWSALVGAADAMGDRIVSGSTNIIAQQDRSLTFTTANTERMVVGEDGFVGIGTAQPRNRVHLHNDGPGYASFQVTNNDTGALSDVYGFRFGLGSNERGIIAAGLGTHGLWFLTSNSIAMSIENSGNVRIGTSGVVPSVSLSVVGEVQVSNSGVICADATRGAIRYTQGTSQLSFCNGALWTPLAAQGSGLEDRIVSGSTSIVAHQDRSLTFSTAGAQRMVIGADGRVGIGTQSPSTGLELAGVPFDPTTIVTGSIALGVPSYGGWNATGAAFINNTLNSNGVLGYAVGANVGRLHFGRVSQNSIVTSMVLSEFGAVGIGVSGGISGTRLAIHTPIPANSNLLASPTEGLRLAWDDRTEAGTGTDVGPGQGVKFAFYGPDNNAVATNEIAHIATFKENGAEGDPLTSLVFGTHDGVHGAHERMRLTSAGRIGVNTTSPRARLDVVGTISASDAIQVGASSLTCGAGIPGAIRYSSPNLQFCNGTVWTTLGAAGATTAASSTGAVQFNVNNALAGDTDNFFWDNANKRLGIGTSTPNASVHVSRTHNGPSLIRVANNSAGVNAYSGLVIENEFGANGWFWTAPEASVYEHARDRVLIQTISGGSSNRGVSIIASDVHQDIRLFAGGYHSPSEVVRVNRQRTHVSGSFVVSTSAQTTTPSLFVGANWNVGVGTSTPAAKLDVYRENVGTALSVVGGWSGSPLATFTRGDGNVAGFGMIPAGNAPSFYISNSSAIWAMGVRGHHFILGRGANNVFALEAPPALTVASDNKIGVNLPTTNTVPLATLDVRGSISATDAIQVGTSSLTCNAGLSGALRYNSTHSTMEYCNSAAWRSLGPSGTTVLGQVMRITPPQSIPHSTWSTVTFNHEIHDTHDLVNLGTHADRITVPAGLGGYYLIESQGSYDSAGTHNTGRWVSLTRNGVQLSGSYCNGVSGPIGGYHGINCTYMLYLSAGDYVGMQAYHNSGAPLNFTNARLGIVKLDGGGSGGGGGGANTLNELMDVNTAGAVNGSILAYNGAQWVVSSTGANAALGDRITSGTHAVTMNSASGVVSLSSAGTTWGYLNSTRSYLPALTSTQVSSTNVSATLLQVGTGNGAACDAGRRGAIRYSTISSTMEYCNSNAWVSMGPSDTVPVSFRAWKSANQTVTAGVETKVTYDQVVYNHGGGFSNSTFTAPVSGLYALNAMVYCRVGTTFCVGNIRMNGGYVASNLVYTTEGILNLSTIIWMNAGSQADVSANNGNGTQLAGGNSYLSFSGSILGAQGGGGGGGGSSDLAGLTDVNLTSLAGRDYLRYDAGTSQWVNVPESTVMSTTTMVPGRPDTIACTLGTITRYLFLQADMTGSTFYAGAYDSGAERQYVFYDPAGAYNGQVGMDGHDCVTNAWSISQLYAQGKAFNFIGNSGVSGGSALGDRITSGTHAVTVNTASGVVSLTTGSTSWGYLSSGNSYLPTLLAGRVSATTVSGSIVEARQRMKTPTIAASAVAGAGGERIVSGSTRVTANQNGTVYVDGALNISRNGTGRILLQDGSASGASAAAWLDFSDSAGNVMGYVGDGSTGNSNIQIHSAFGSVQAISGGNTCTYSSGASWSCSSDARMKDRVLGLENSLEKIVQLRGVSYHWRDKAKAGKRHIGFIAQDVQKVFPDVVVANDDDGMLQLDYAALIAPMVEAMKELKEENDILGERLDASNDNVQSLSRALDALRLEIQDLRKTNSR